MKTVIHRARLAFLAAILCAGPGLAIAADPIAVPAADFPRPSHPQMGVNLEMVVDFSHSIMFADMIKSARKFGSPETPWDESSPVDDHGWPTGDAGVVVSAGKTSPGGDYSFSCDGKCDLGVVATNAHVKNLSYDKTKKRTTATITLEPNSENFFINFKNTEGGVRNIHLLRPGYVANDGKKAPTFTKEFLKSVEPFCALRTMDFTRTNDTDVVEWKDRPKPDDALQTSTRGVAWEYAIELANVSKKDLWINVPDQASDDYVKQLAQLMKGKLDHDRNVYVEYSNEVWNYGFKQAGRNLDAAKKEVDAGDTKLNDGGKDDNAYYWGWKRVSKRLLEISAIFKDVFGDGSINTRIRPVLASQSAQPFMLRMQIDFIEKNYGPPSQFIYGIAGAPYFGPDDKVTEGDDPTVDDLFKATDINKVVKDWMMQYLVTARYYRVHALSYEGGLAVTGEHNLDVKVGWNKDPRIADVAKDYFKTWYGQGGELFMYYNLAGPWSKYGTWGLYEDIREPTLKSKAIADLAKGEPPAINVGSEVPGFIEGSKFDSNTGGKVEDAANGGKNVGFLSDGNTLDYLLNVKDAGTYTIAIQASSIDKARIGVSLSGTALGTLDAPRTGDYQKYDDTDPIKVKLERGQIVLRLKVVRSGFNVRSITIQKTS